MAVGNIGAENKDSPFVIYLQGDHQSKACNPYPMNGRSPIHCRPSSQPTTLTGTLPTGFQRTPRYSGKRIGRSIQCSLGQEIVVQGIAGWSSATGGNLVRNFDGEIEDRVHVRTIESEILADGNLSSISSTYSNPLRYTPYIVSAPRAVIS
jgi:hypothetical protein